jgi:glycosyltransferase involved in cell wall biosynthesis
VKAVASGPSGGGSGSRLEASAKAEPPAVTIVANDVRAIGGMERVLTELITGLRDLGHHVTVIARTLDGPAAAEGVVFHRVRAPSRPFLIAYPWFVVAGSITVARRRTGIVQATGAIVLNRVDVVAVHYCHQVGQPRPSRSSLLFRAHTSVVAVVKRVMERVCFHLNMPRAVVCVSQGVADEVRRHYPKLAARVSTIQNGVDAERFAPGRRQAEARRLRAQLGIADGRLVALFIAGEWEGKGLRQLIGALALAPGWVLVVVGKGDRRSYEQLAGALGVAADVRWLGVTRDVQLAYALADAFVFPSAYESFSLVTFEAAASGLPIISTAVSGARELIRDGVTGLFTSRDPADIALHLTQLAADPALRLRLGQAARQASLRFSWEAMVTRHHELYERLTASSALPAER